MQMSREQQEEIFRRTWHAPKGFPAALSAVNNQPIGMRFMATAFIFFLIGGVMGLLIRLQLIVPENNLINPQLFNELFTMHGSTMMYLFIVPFLEGLALYLLPQMLGSRDVAFPRLTAFSYWVYLFGGIIFYVSFLVGSAPDAGWFAYTPLSGPGFAGVELDFWLLGLAMVEIAGIGAGIEIVVTILKLRAPGMALNRMPIFAWTMLVSGVMIIFAFTVLVVATVLLEMDRMVGTQFFSPDAGGSSLLWQHLFWFFGHPDVYIMFLPATGIVSMVIPVFARRPLAVYTLVIIAIVVTGFLSFGLWVHHMYTTGLPILAMNFFAAASLMIAIASGIQVFAWIATMWGRPLKFDPPFMYVLGFLFIFVIGGMTGVMIAVVPFDWQVHDTYFIVAHFHYVLVGGVVFPIMAAVHFWIPKMTGRMLNAKLGHWAFWLIFLGFNITFFPMHIMGLLGMPRRVYTYPAVLEVGIYNIIATAGSFILAIGILVFIWNVIRSWRRGASAGDDPWRGETLEWSIPSPPPSYSFEIPPFASSRQPLQGDATSEEPERFARARQALKFGPPHWRATLVTDTVTGEPQGVQWLPGPTYLPLFAALGLLISCSGLLLQLYLVSLFGVVLTGLLTVRWLWHSRRTKELLRNSIIEKEASLPVFLSGSLSVGWWGLVWLLVCLGTATAALIYSYFFIRMMSEQWPQNDLPMPDLLLPLIAVGALIIGSGAQWLAGRFFHHGSLAQTHAALAATVITALTFLGVQGYILAETEFRWDVNAYASFFHLMNWLIAFFVAAGVAMNLAAHVRLARDGNDARSFVPLQMQLTSMYWHFTVAAAVAVVATVYLSPHAL